MTSTRTNDTPSKNRKKPAARKPSSEQAMAEEAGPEEAVAEGPSPEKAVAEEAGVEAAVSDGPSSERAVVEAAVSEGPSSERAVVEAAVSEGPSSEEVGAGKARSDRRSAGRSSSAARPSRREPTIAGRRAGEVRARATTDRTARIEVDRRRSSRVDRRTGGRRDRRRGKGGVAPFVPPASRRRRALARRRLLRRGFVPLSPGRPRLHHRILPRTVIGISFVLLAFAVGAAFSGAAFYAYYDNRLAESEATVARFIEGFDQQFSDAAGVLERLRKDSIDDIQAELAPLADHTADAQGVRGLPTTAGPSVWLVETRDEAGERALAAAFAVAPHEGGTAFITSYEAIAASTITPAPLIELVKDDRRLPAQLWAWDKGRDLAVVVVDEVVPALPLADDGQQVGAVGGRVFALSGVGGQGAAASPGVLLDHSAAGLQHTAPVGTLYRGGPLLTGDGIVVGVATLAYQPFGVDQGQVQAAPGVAALCARVLSCPTPSRPVVAGDAEAPFDPEG